MASLRARILGMAKSQTDFVEELKRRGIKEAEIYKKEHPPVELDEMNYTIIERGGKHSVYLVLQSPDGKVRFRSYVTEYDYHHVVGGGEGDGYYPDLSQVMQRTDDSKAELKKFLKENGIQIAYSWQKAN